MYVSMVWLILGNYSVHVKIVVFRKNFNPYRGETLQMFIWPTKMCYEITNWGLEILNFIYFSVQIDEYMWIKLCHKLENPPAVILKMWDPLHTTSEITDILLHWKMFVIIQNNVKCSIPQSETSG